MVERILCEYVVVVLSSSKETFRIIITVDLVMYRLQLARLFHKQLELYKIERK